MGHCRRPSADCKFIFWECETQRAMSRAHRPLTLGFRAAFAAAGVMVRVLTAPFIAESAAYVAYRSVLGRAQRAMIRFCELAAELAAGQRWLSNRESSVEQLSFTVVRNFSCPGRCKQYTNCSTLYSTFFRSENF